MNPPPPPIVPAPAGSAILTLLGWAFILTGAIGLPISLISGAMFAMSSYGTQNASAAGFFTVVLGPAAVLVCGIGLLRHWTWAWWGALLLAALLLSFSLRDFLKKPAPPVTYISETGTRTTVYSSGGGIAALTPLLISGGVLVLLLLPSVRAPFSLRRPSPAPASSSVPLRPGDAAISAVQQEILAALRAGAEFRTAHKEGGTTIRWQRGRFVRQDYGDWSERAEYTDEAAFLAFLERFFEWESRSFQKIELPSAQRWGNIRQLLHGQAPSGGTTAEPESEISPLWTPAAFVIAAAAVALIVWLRGGIHWRTPQAKDPSLQRLDTFDGTPPKVTQPDFKLPRRDDPPGP